MRAIGNPLCSAEGAHEYLGRKTAAIVTSVQNGDNSPSTATGSNYLGTVPSVVAVRFAPNRGLTRPQQRTSHAEPTRPGRADILCPTFPQQLRVLADVIWRLLCNRSECASKWISAHFPMGLFS
jgi:hypothetical protein